MTDRLKDVDAEAKRVGTNRSALLQRAAEAYLEKIRQEQEEVERRRRMEEACRKMDELAKKAGDWDPVSVIRFHRNTRYGPQWHKTRTNPVYPGRGASRR